MKTINIFSQSTDVNALLDEARREALIVRAPDGDGFMVAAVDDFDREIVSTRRNAKLMAFPDERVRREKTLPLDEVKRQLGL